MVVYYDYATREFWIPNSGNDSGSQMDIAEDRQQEENPGIHGATPQLPPAGNFDDDEINAADHLVRVVSSFSPFDTLAAFNITCHFSSVVRNRQRISNPNHQMGSHLGDQALQQLPQVSLHPFPLSWILPGATRIHNPTLLQLRASSEPTQKPGSRIMKSLPMMRWLGGARHRRHTL